MHNQRYYDAPNCESEAFPPTVILHHAWCEILLQNITPQTPHHTLHFLTSAVTVVRERQHKSIRDNTRVLPSQADAP
jgi:hypothetical protein